MGCALAADLTPKPAAVSPLNHWRPFTLFTVSADLLTPADPRSSASIRLLGVATGVLDTNEPRGTRGDEAFVVETLGGEKPLHSSTPPAPRPPAMLRGGLCPVCPVCVEPNEFPLKVCPERNNTHSCHWPIRSLYPLADEVHF